MSSASFRCFTVVSLACFVAAFAAHGGQLRAGAGKTSITPATDEFPYLPSDTASLNLAAGERPFVGVHDEIFARALILDDGKQRVALISLEVTAVPKAEALENAVAEQLNIPAAHVMVIATHTHNVPLFSYAGGAPIPRETREIAALRQGALDAVRQASAHMQPARIVAGRGEAFVNINSGEEKGSRSGTDATGSSDKTLDVIRLDAMSGKPIALLVNYASHAEVMFRSVTQSGGYEVSGDLPGAVSRLLEASPDSPLVMMTPAAEGDQRSLFKSLQPPGLLPAHDEGAAGWAILDVQARRLAESILAVDAALPGGETDAHLTAATRVVTCPGQELRVEPGTGEVVTSPMPSVGIALSMIRVNDIVLGGVSGDVGSLIGQRFRESSSAAHTIMVSMVGDSIGPIFTDAAYLHPGHSIEKSRLAPHCAEHAVVDGLLGLMLPTRP